MPPTCEILPMTLADYPAVMELMETTSGLSVREADSYEAIARYLDRNPMLSFVARFDESIVACVMSGHDGRRGYLHHLVVHHTYRRRGIASALVEKCLAVLEAAGIKKTHIDVFRANELAQEYWQSQGWQLRSDIHRYSFIRHGGENA